MESVDRVFCLEVRGMVKFGERIEEAVERWRWWWRVREAEARDEGFGEGSAKGERAEERKLK
jgi:hypothetical protein